MSSNPCEECKREYSDARLTEFDDGVEMRICTACLGIEWHKEWRYLVDENDDLKKFTDAENDAWEMRKNVK